MNHSLRISRALSVVACALGVLVLLGWIVGSSLLRAAGLGTVPMAPVAALGFILAGLSLWLLALPAGVPREATARERFGRLLAWTVLLNGAIAIRTYVVGRLLGYESFGFVPPDDGFRGIRLAMAPTAATGFVLVGIALLLVARPRFTRAIVWVLLPVFALAWFGVSVFAIGASPILPAPAMSLSAAIGLLALSIGVLSARSDGGIFLLLENRGPAGAMVRLLLPAIVVLPLIFVWFRFDAPLATWMDASTSLALFALATMGARAALVWYVAARLNHMELQRQADVQRLRESESRYRRLFDSSPYCVHEIDQEGRLILMNRAGLAMMGLQDEQAVRGMPYVSAVSAEDRERVGHLLQIAFEGQASEFEFTSINGLALRSSFVPITDDQGVVERVMGLTEDVTARRHAQEALRAAEAQAHQGEKMLAVGTLAGGIAHDFNNILGAILGNVELAEQDLEAGHPAAESLAQIRKSGRRAADLVKRLLNVSRPQTATRSVVNLRTAVLDDIPLFRAMLPAGVELAVRLDERVSDIVIDPTELHQVLLNLITNAWQAIGGQGGCISLALEDVDAGHAAGLRPPGVPPGRYARLSVTDTGHGMDAETRDRIFDPFFTTKDVGKGTGLGLSVVHRIVTSLDGAITVDSAPGQGATFAVYFPAAAGASTRRVAGTATVPRGRGEHVLVVDDEEPLLTVTTRMLERQGYRATGVSGAVDAITAMAVAPDAYDILVVDYNMPGATGLELARDIRAQCPGKPIILASGHVPQGLDAEAATAGVGRLLRKPYSAAELCAALRDLLDLEPGRVA